MSAAAKRATVQEDHDDLAVFAARATEPTLSFESALKELKRNGNHKSRSVRAVVLSWWSLWLFLGAVMAALVMRGE